MVEQILSWYQKIFGISYTALRYFNACGASLDGEHGERHNPETHIIPRAMQALLSNEPFELFGEIMRHLMAPVYVITFMFWT